MGCFTLEDEGITIFRNFGNHLPNFNASCPRILEFSSFIWQFGCNTEYDVGGPVLISFAECTSTYFIYLPCSMFANLFLSLFMFYNPTSNALCTPLSFEVDPFPLLVLPYPQTPVRSLLLTVILRNFYSVFVLRVGNFLRYSPLNRCACLQ